MREMGAQPFIGSEALAAGLISWHELGKYYTAIMPNVYLDKRLKPSLRPHTRGLRQLDKALDLVDPGAQSPKETWLPMSRKYFGCP